MIHISSETLSINIGQVIIGVSLPLITLELGNHLKTVMGVVAVIARRISPQIEAFIALALCQSHDLRKQPLAEVIAQSTIGSNKAISRSRTLIIRFLKLIAQFYQPFLSIISSIFGLTC